MISRADAVTLYRVRGRLLVIAFPITFATDSGGPPNLAVGPS
jgi:hypothetical protein